MVFWDGDVNRVMKDKKQITPDLNYNDLQKQFTMTFVYAKCKDYIRIHLWDIMLQQAEIKENPWCSVGEYNVTTSDEEKLGGISLPSLKLVD